MESEHAASSREIPSGPRRPLRRSDFLRATQRGRRVSSRFFIVFVLDRDAGGSGPARREPAEDAPAGPEPRTRGPARLGITVTRKVGNAVRRNRIKRLVREWFRTAKQRLGPYDVVVIAKRSFPTQVKLAEVKQDLDGALCVGPGAPRRRRTEEAGR